MLTSQKRSSRLFGKRREKNVTPFDGVTQSCVRLWHRGARRLLFGSKVNHHIFHDSEPERKRHIEQIVVD